MINLENIDIADVIGLGGIALAAVFTILMYLRRPQLGTVLAIAFLLRGAAALFHHFIRPLPDGALDAASFAKNAADWSATGLWGALENWGELGMSWTYSNVASLIYVVVGPSPLLLQSFSVMAGVGAVVLAYRLVLVLWGDEKWAIRAAAIAAVFPTLVLYSALTMREPFTIVLFLMALLYLVQWARTGRYWPALVSIGLFFLQVFLHAGLVLGGIAVAGLVAWDTVRTVMVRLGKGYIRIVPALVTLSVVVGLALFWYRLAGVAIPYIGVVSGIFDLTIILTQATNVAVEAGSAWPGWLVPDSVLLIPLVTPIRMLYFMYSPMPWDIRSVGHVIGLFDAALYMGITWYIIRNRREIWSNRAAKMILLVLVPLILAFAWGTGNSGTAVRHRSKLVIALIALAGTRIPRLRLFGPHRKYPLLHTPRKLLYLVIETSFFVSHRLPLGVAAKEAGYDVAVVSDARKNADAVTDAGLRLIPFEIDRKGVNPLAKLPTLFRLWRLYRRERPEVVHHIALKPILLGGLVARLTRVPTVVGSVTGLGFLYIDERRLPLVRKAVELLLPLLLDVAIVQNADDAAILHRIGMPPERVRLIPGAGVDTGAFAYAPEPTGTPVVMFPARLLWDKGVQEFVDAARLLKAEGVDARFVLVGDTDLGNRAGVPLATLDEWKREGAVETWGFSADMPTTFAQANLVVLPSYREGLPKTLLEAAAVGRAVVTTDTTGCRDAVAAGETGLTVPVRDARALAAAIRTLLADPERRAAMGRAGRVRVERAFATGTINPLVLETYESRPEGRSHIGGRTPAGN